MEPERDGNGRTAKQFLSELFEFEYCSECGGDETDHTAILWPFNLWFAKCNREKVETC